MIAYQLNNLSHIQHQQGCTLNCRMHLFSALYQVL